MVQTRHGSQIRSTGSILELPHWSASGSLRSILRSDVRGGLRGYLAGCRYCRRRPHRRMDRRIWRNRNSQMDSPWLFTARDLKTTVRERTRTRRFQFMLVGKLTFATLEFDTCADGLCHTSTDSSCPCRRASRRLSAALHGPHGIVRLSYW